MNDKASTDDIDGEYDGDGDIDGDGGVDGDSGVDGDDGGVIFMYIFYSNDDHTRAEIFTIT